MNLLLTLFSYSFLLGNHHPVGGSSGTYWKHTNIFGKRNGESERGGSGFIIRDIVDASRLEGGGASLLLLLYVMVSAVPVMGVADARCSIELSLLEHIISRNQYFI